jgi:pSer/pThr/pTyr-binding forkhead associated (FHA) protein
VTAAPTQTGSQKAAGGPPARPTFQSSAAAPATAATGPRYGLTVLAGPARGQRFKLAASGAQIGRSRGAILFPEDPFVSALHASLAVRDGKLFIRDEASTSGIYVSINGQETVPAGATFCAGLRLFRYVGPVEPVAPTKSTEVQTYGAPLPNGAEHYVIEEVLLGDRPSRALMTPGPTITIGQSGCDLTFSSDEGLAKRHCEVAPMPNGAMVRDLSGGLGTYVRCQGERAIRPGDRLRIGQQTLQVEELK